MENIIQARYTQDFLLQIKKKADMLVNYFLISYFVIGLILAFYYDTWLIAIGVGGLSLLAYYITKLALPNSTLYEYVLSTVLGIFMAQFIYQMHGLFEMHFFAFIGSAILISYQNWKLQIPLALVVVIHHAGFGYLQYIGYYQIYFTQLEYMTLQTFVIHGILATGVFVLCGFWAYYLKNNSLEHIKQSFEIGKLQEAEEQKEALLELSEDLKASNERLKEAQRIATIGNWEYCMNTDKFFWSEEMSRIFGRRIDMNTTRYEVFYNMIHPDDKEEVMQLILKCIMKSEPFAHECRIQTNKASSKIINIQGKPVFDNDVPKVIGIIQDITERKMHEESLKKSEANLNTIFNNTDTAYILLDPEFRLVSFNEPAQKFAYKQLHRALTESDYFIEYFNKSQQATLAATLESVLNGNTVDYDLSYQKGNIEIWYNAQYFPIITKEKIFGIILKLTDITKRKQDEFDRTKITEDLIQHNKDLEQFGYIVSHNLRAPVANIKGTADVLSDLNLDDEERQMIIDDLSTSVKKLDEVILDLNNILLIKKESAQENELVNFSSIIKDVTMSMGNLINPDNVEIKSDFREIDEMMTLKSYLYSIFYNLISNSIKYKKPHIPCVVEIKSYKKDDKIRLVFKDNGLGIDLDKKSSMIFGLYKRFHNHVEGKGIGLFMVKTQIESLKGTIFVKSEVNVGTEFIIDFNKDIQKQEKTVLINEPVNNI
jgi:PAS domain S-box-containing protein